MITKKNLSLIILLFIFSCYRSELGELVWHHPGLKSDAPIFLSFKYRDGQAPLMVRQNQTVLNTQFDGDSVWVIFDPESISVDKNSVVMKATSVNQVSDLSYERTDSILTLNLRGKPVLTYVTGLTNVPGRNDSVYMRNGFIHPLWSPNGAILSGIHPQDHLHHLGLWHPWTRTVIHGKKIDFWNLGDKQGTVRFKKIKKLIKGPLFAGFEAMQVFYQIENGNQLIPAINEKISVRLWDIPKLKGYLIDYMIQQECAIDDSIYLPQYRYGGFGFRATPEWHGENRFYLTSEGKDLFSADDSNARWCIVGGKTSKGPSSILFMSHPSNHAHPEPVRIWGDFSQDIFFNFCPVKKHSWTFFPDKTYTLRYCLFISDTIIKSSYAERLWQAYANPGYLELKEL